MLGRIFYFLFSVLAATSIVAEPRMLDRLILEINSKSYTQRQIEIYHALRTIAMGEPIAKALPSSSGWKDAVEIFKNEILVYSNIENDPQRMESFQPDNKALQEAEALVQKAQLEHDGFRGFLRGYQVSETEIIRNLLTFFRVQAYVRSRIQVIGPTAGGSVPPLLSIDAKSDWFSSLQRMTPYRLFDRAKEYRPIELKKSS
jgi:hypothetical protein